MKSRAQVKLAVSQDKAQLEAFPLVDPGLIPFGPRVLVQVRLPRRVTSGGILLHDLDREAEKANTQVAKVIALGPLAYKSRDVMKPWPEGQWCKQGDFVRIPRFGGDRWEVDHPDGSRDKVTFVMFKDLDILGAVQGDPLAVRSYL